jgi:hypothetical protein
MTEHELIADIAKRAWVIATQRDQIGRGEQTPRAQENYLRAIAEYEARQKKLVELWRQAK